MKLNIFITDLLVFTVEYTIYCHEKTHFLISVQSMQRDTNILKIYFLSILLKVAHSRIEELVPL
jgi:hypothetical protein